MAGRKISSTLKRVDLRDKLWPGIAAIAYPSPAAKGWCKVPRVIPLVLQLLSDKRLSGGMDLTRTYVGLLCDNFGDGLVEIDDERQYALVAGFKGERGLRSWRDRVRTLSKLGFIETVERGTAAIGFVCIIDPYAGVKRCEERGYPVPVAWRTDFLAKLAASGALGSASQLMFPGLTPPDSNGDRGEGNEP